MAVTIWFYLRDGREYGPIPLPALRQLAQSGDLLPTDMVRREDRPEWVMASSVNGLFDKPTLPTAVADPPAEVPLRVPISITKSTKRQTTVKETRATCKACGQVWHYKTGDVMKEASDGMQDCGCTLMSCGLYGCLSPFMQKKDYSTSKCPKCGSRAISSETVVHQI